MNICQDSDRDPHLLQNLSEAVPRENLVPFQSPSLAAGEPSGKAAYEVKFLLSEAAATELEWHFVDLLTLDPHAVQAQDHSYSIQTIYLDTPELDVFHRRGDHRHWKLRIRSYGQNETFYLEQKSRHEGRVLKQRVAVTASELEILNQTQEVTAWSGSWFHEVILKHKLSPVYQVKYLRRAYFGSAEGRSVRLTFDRNVRGEQSDRWRLSSNSEMSSLLPDLVICEMKFQESMPLLFKAAMEQHALVPRGCSKYRHCLQQSMDRAARGADCA